eukprot:scaffold412996_cov59-Attheya_sp.AAC.1
MGTWHENRMSMFLLFLGLTACCDVGFTFAFGPAVRRAVVGPPPPQQQQQQQHFSNTKHTNTATIAMLAKRRMVEDETGSTNGILNGVEQGIMSTRRRILTEIATGAMILSNVSPSSATEMVDSPSTSSLTADPVRVREHMKAAWSAVDGLNSFQEEKAFVSFDASAYAAMRDDPSRTPLFQKAIASRLQSAPGGPESQTVLDLGTGPFALFAIIAAEQGAGKVYAMEADPEIAKSARETVKRSGFADVITILEGFSTDIPSLPNNDKVDFVVAEIVGSIATEEGAYASIKDARRFVKDPNVSSSWIPCAIQTYAAPASYTLHNLFGPPEFDWSKLSGEPVRFNCRDMGLQLLSDPQLVEHIGFANIMSQPRTKTKGSQSSSSSGQLSFTVSGDRMRENEDKFYTEYINARLPKGEAQEQAPMTAHSCSGIALWPRLLLDDTYIVNSRMYPSGGHQRSHWQTVLPITSDRPIQNIQDGDKIVVQFDLELEEVVAKPPRYKIEGDVIFQS